ncbi:MAG: kinase/pyrophosphorylase [Thermoleophilia bacterium]|nr:kinase/pyrophosphorylase [Thermoleophilia bacterium]PHX81061.1 MAG: phosphoenolpyruvate synthase regulatory protein [Thermoleophilia bacterium]
MSNQPVEIHIISDSTGDTASRVARAVQAQFSASPVKIVRHPRVTTLEGLQAAFTKLRGQSNTAVFFTLIDRDLRERASELCERHGLPSCDLLGAPLEALQQVSGSQAELVPGRPVGLEIDYFKRVAAMEFAVKHDDGLSGEGLDEADIVIVGVSRTGKTPLSMYLGYLGYKTANIPLVPAVEPPQQLFRIDRAKIVGLTIDPERLQRIRGRRLRAMGGRARNNYADLAKILEELDDCTGVFRKLGCPVIDVSNLAVEESALRVINLVEERSHDDQEASNGVS